MSQISDAVAKNTAAVQALVTAAGSIDIATQADIDALTANTTSVNGVTTTLGGTPPA